MVTRDTPCLYIILVYNVQKLIAISISDLVSVQCGKYGGRNQIAKWTR